jgi:hypothetical protein
VRRPPTTTPSATRAGLIARLYRKVVTAAILAAAACTASRADVILDADDLIGRLGGAERRAAGPVDEWIRIGSAGAGDDRRVALLTTAPARVIWTARIPERAWIETAVMLVDGAGAAARIGIADSRVYELLARVELAPRGEGDQPWQPLRVDLRKYAGWQWSVFYRPSTTEWQLVFSADALPGGTIAWSHPVIKRKR